MDACTRTDESIGHAAHARLIAVVGVVGVVSLALSHGRTHESQHGHDEQGHQSEAAARPVARQS